MIGSRQPHCNEQLEMGYVLLDDLNDDMEHNSHSPTMALSSPAAAACFGCSLPAGSRLTWPCLATDTAWPPAQRSMAGPAPAAGPCAAALRLPPPLPPAGAGSSGRPHVGQRHLTMSEGAGTAAGSMAAGAFVLLLAAEDAVGRQQLRLGGWCGCCRTTCWCLSCWPRRPTSTQLPPLRTNP